MSYQVKQQATPHGEGWWKWSVWLDGTSEDLDQVDFVEYILHPTFPQPVQKIKDRGSQFRLEASGWGEFNIHVQVYRKDGGVEKLEHWLSFDVPEAPVRGMVESSFSVEGKTVVYISCAAADSSFAASLVQALEQEGIQAMMNEDLDPSQSPGSMIRPRRWPFNAVLFIISDVKNPWLENELKEMKAAGVPLYAVIVGSNTKVPPEIPEGQRFQIKDLAEANATARSIAARLAG